MTKTVLLNVKYSPNLGDGVIAECLEAEIARCLPNAEVTSLDLAGRKKFGDGLDQSRGLVLRVLQALPAGLRSFAISLILRALIQLRYKKTWQEILDGADGAILGGGQIVADANLNFPLKVSAVLRLVARRNIPLAIFGVGVARHMSQSGVRLFTGAFAKSALSHVAVRDIQSQRNWSGHFAASTKQEAHLCLDPGLLACERYSEIATVSERQPAVIGLGITNPQVLALHSDIQETHLLEELREFWICVAKELIGRGFVPKLFTNGPADDEAFLESILNSDTGFSLERAPRPGTPAEMVSTIASFQAVAAHRLHANIVAYSLKIPHVGFRWDRKLESFMEMVGRGDYLVDATSGDAVGVVDTLEAAIQSRVDEIRHAEILNETRAAIAMCLSKLSSGKRT